MYGKAYGKHLKIIFMIIFLLFVVSSLECSLATDIDKIALLLVIIVKQI